MSNDGHEGTLEMLKYVDNIIFNFMNNLFNDNLLKNTSIILMSDHGDGMPSIYFPYDFYRIEKHLPMLYMIINDRKNFSYEEQYKNIYENQQTFIKNKTKNHDTPKSPYGKSLFEKINQKIRNPELYQHLGPMIEEVCKKVI